MQNDALLGTEQMLEKLRLDTRAAKPDEGSIPATATRSYKIRGVQTDMYCQVFSDRYLFCVSQLDGRIGTYVLSEAIPSEINPKDIEYQVSTLLGSRTDPMPALYARRLTEDLMKLRSPSKIQPLPPILLGISLKKDMIRDPAVLGTINEKLIDLLKDLHSS